MATLIDPMFTAFEPKLKNRFVDQPGNFFLDKIKKGNNLNVTFKNDNHVETNIASIKGFNLRFNDDINSIRSNLVNSRAKKTILKMIPERIDSLIKAPDEAFNFGNLNESQMNSLPYIYWGEDPVGYLEKGESIFLPKLSVLNSELLDSHNREKISKRLQLHTEFSPSPNETINLIKEHYEQINNLLITFKNDKLDQNNLLLQCLKERDFDESEIIQIEGNHLTPVSLGLKEKLIKPNSQGSLKYKKINFIVDQITHWEI